MAVFISTKIDGITHEVVYIAWHTRVPIFAVAIRSPSDSGEVAVFNQEESKGKFLTVSRPYVPTVVAWHPFKTLLLIGWSSGCVTAYHVSDGNSIDLKPILGGQITSIVWSISGSVVVVTDSKGAVRLWRHSPFGELQHTPIINSNFDSKIMCTIFVEISCKTANEDLTELVQNTLTNQEEKLSVQLDSRKIKEMPYEKNVSSESSNFLLGCSDGRIICFVVNDKSDSEMSVLANCEGSVLNMLCHTSKGILIVITDKGLLYHFSINQSKSFSIKEVTKMKVATNISSHPSLTWAGSTVLAMAFGEPVVRLWDVEKADNYTLTPNISDCDNSHKTVQVLQVAYSPTYQILAAGLNNGMVAFWQYGTELENIDSLIPYLYAEPTWIPGYDTCQDNNHFAIKKCSYSLDCEIGPENNWYPQPSTMWINNRPDEEFSPTSVLPSHELNRHVYLLSWDGRFECLTIAMCSRLSGDNQTFNNG